MQRVVLTGGPGAGKTSVLDGLCRLGYETGSDAARSVIRARKEAGLSPRPDTLSFAREILKKEIEAYESVSNSPAFFERGVVDVVGLLLVSNGVAMEEVSSLISLYRYNTVFIFPPWEEIYCTDDERDHSFSHSVNVYESTLSLYEKFDYDPITVPRAGVAERVNFIVRHI